MGVSLKEDRMKEIFKIILLRQVILPFICLLLLVLILPNATVILAAKTAIKPELLATIFVSTLFVVIFAIWYVWYPFTCISIWKTSNNLRPGWIQKLSKSYAAILLIMIIVPGIYALPKLPDIYSKLETHNQQRNMDSGADAPPPVR